MFRILVTTKYSATGGVSVHTLVVEFTTKDAAEIAVNNINNADCNHVAYSHKQTATRLYQVYV